MHKAHDYIACLGLMNTICQAPFNERFENIVQLVVTWNQGYVAVLRPQLGVSYHITACLGSNLLYHIILLIAGRRDHLSC